jgi:hypothetical protein
MSNASLTSCTQRSLRRQKTRATGTRLLANGPIGLIAGVLLFLLQSTSLPLPAHAGSALDSVRAINAEIRKHEANIAKMHAELAANPRQPDASKLRDVLATAGGQRSQAFHNLNPELQRLVNNFERSVEKNVGGSVAMALGGASARTQYIVEISRSTQLIDAMKELRESLLEQAQKEAYEERMDRLQKERDAAESAPATPGSTGPSGVTTSSMLPHPDRLPGWDNGGWRNPGLGPVRTASNWPTRNPSSVRGPGRGTPKGAGSGSNCHTNPTTGALHCLGNNASPSRFGRTANTRWAMAPRFTGSRINVGRMPQTRAPRLAGIYTARSAYGARGFARRRF